MVHELERLDLDSPATTTDERTILTLGFPIATLRRKNKGKWIAEMTTLGFFFYWRSHGFKAFFGRVSGPVQFPVLGFNGELEQTTFV